MEDLIIDVGRSGSRGGRHALASQKRSTQRCKLSQRRGDDLPSTERMTISYNRVAEKNFTDRLEPFERWLRKQVGRPWDKVYAEFCEVTDARTIRSWHLKTHLDSLVDLGQERSIYRRFGLYVDEKGVLRYESPRSWKRAQLPPPKNIKRVLSEMRDVVIWTRGLKDFTRNVLVDVYHFDAPNGKFEIVVTNFIMMPSKYGAYKLNLGERWPESFGEKPRVLENKSIVSKRQLPG